MKIFLYLIAFRIASAWAQTPLTAAIGQLPNCAIECILQDIQSSSCTLNNQTCICTNAAFQNNVTQCVTKSCTVKESLVTKNVTETACGAPVRDRAKLYDNVSIGLGVVAGFFLVQRLLLKVLAADLMLTIDDWSILVTRLVGIPTEVLNVRGLTPNGLGKDVWTLPFDKITAFGHDFFAEETLYFAQVSLLKLSILLFYLRIFPAKPVRQILLGTIAFNCVFGFIFVLVSIFQCRPISFYWTKWDGEHKGTCLDINAIGWSNAAISIAIDIWMLAVPMWQLKSLQLHWKKKIGVGLMFFVGTFVTVVSIFRLSSLLTFANSDNPTWDQFGVALFSTIELNVGVICACMPSVRILLNRLFPEAMGSNLDNKRKTHLHGRTLSQTLNNTLSQKHKSRYSEDTESLRHIQDSDDVRSVELEMENVDPRRLPPPVTQADEDERTRRTMIYLNLKPLPLIGGQSNILSPKKGSGGER